MKALGFGLCCRFESKDKWRNMSKVILVIEDQEDNRRIMRDLLKSADYGIVEAVTGEEGVRSAETHHPDLILMDIQLPDFRWI